MSRGKTSLVLMVLLTGVFWNNAAVAEPGNLGDQLFKLTADDAAVGDFFGRSVGISGNTAIVGARTHDVVGSAYLFDVTTGNQLWKLTAADSAANDRFGFSVAISGNTAIVGARFSGDGGSAYLFDVTTGTQLRKLTADDAAVGDNLGFSVAIDISKLFAVVGAPADDDGGTSSGSAYLFSTISGSHVKLTADDAAAGDLFGWSVAISGNTAIVGAFGDTDTTGSAYVFELPTGLQLRKLTADDGAADDRFGLSVAISGDIAIVGAKGDDGGSGSAYVFNVTTGDQLFKLANVDPAAFDSFGHDVAISGNTAIVATILDDDGGVNSGSAYLFDVTTGTQLTKLTADDAAAFDLFAHSVAISGNTAIVGQSPDAGSASGSAYLFDASKPVPVRLVSLQVRRSDLGAVLAWEIADASDHAGFHVHRQSPGSERGRLTDSLLRGQTAYRFIDESPPKEGAEYWLAEISRTGETTWYGPAVLSPASLSARLTLGPGVPNPFRSQTQISYSIPVAEHVELSIYDLHGRRVATLVDQEQGLGTYTESWDGRIDTGRAASGLYFLRLRAGKTTKIQKLLFAR